MSDFIVFATYPDREQSILLVALLKQAEIEYQIEEEGSSLASLASGIPQLDRIIIKIKEADFEKANELLDKEEAAINVDHYLYTFSDEDLLDVLKNTGDWTQEELEIANKIISERGISPKQKKEKPAELLVVKDKTTKDEEKKRKTTPELRAGELLMLKAVLTIIYILLANLKTNFFSDTFALPETRFDFIFFMFMSPFVKLLSDIYGFNYGILYSAFVFFIGVLVNKNKKPIVVLGLILIICDTYTYIHIYDSWFLGVIQIFWCFLCIKELNKPIIPAGYN